MVKYIFLFSILFFISSVNANISCNFNQVSYSYDSTNSGLFQISCISTSNSTPNIITAGETNYYSINPVQIDSIFSTPINITFKSGTPSGMHYGSLSFSNDSLIIPIFFNVTTPTITNTQDSCSIDIFPLSMSNIKVSQGQIATRNIQLSVPDCYNSSVKIQGINLATNQQPIELGELNTGTVRPGNSVQFPVNIDTNGVSTGTYQDTLSFLLYNDLGKKIIVPNVNINVMVTSGISAINNFSFDMLPVCSVNSIVLNLNNTYTLSCTVNNPNFQVCPDFNKSFFTGLSVSTSSTQYSYNFKGIKVGSSTFCANFVYQGSIIGNPFCQELKINPTGQNVGSGTSLDIQFFQSGQKKSLNQLLSLDTIITPVDNSTGNIITTYDIYINGIKTNSSTLKLSSDQTYQLRVVASGYNDLILDNLTCTQSQLSVVISPDKEVYNLGDMINITSNQDNVTILLDNIKISSPYYIGTSGNMTISVKKEGYDSNNRSIYVKNNPSVVACTPLSTDWNKGTNVKCTISENASWEVYSNNKISNTGTGNTLDFKISDYGNLQINANGKSIYSIQVTKKFSYFNPLSWDYSSWVTWLIIVIIIIIVGYIILRINKSKNSYSPTASYS